MHSLLDQLEKLTPAGYTDSGPPTAEPVAWASLALHGAGRNDGASRAAEWLVEQQQRDGSVPASHTKGGPYWTTSLAILTWQQLDSQRYETQTTRAVEYLLASEGRTMPRNPNMGHDTTLVGWSWNPDTHSWLEPTAFTVMALRSAGYADHPRTAEAVRLLVDRLLPEGGCNYGNTEVLGQILLPHLQPSGVVLWSLAAEGDIDPRINKSLDLIEQMLEQPTGCSSLAFALLALTAWNRRPANADQLIAEALERPSARQSPYKLALLALASQQQPLVAGNFHSSVAAIA